MSTNFGPIPILFSLVCHEDTFSEHCVDAAIPLRDELLSLFQMFDEAYPCTTFKILCAKRNSHEHRICEFVESLYPTGRWEVVCQPYQTLHENGRIERLIERLVDETTILLAISPLPKEGATHLIDVEPNKEDDFLETLRTQFREGKVNHHVTTSGVDERAPILNIYSVNKARSGVRTFWQFPQFVQPQPKALFLKQRYSQVEIERMRWRSIFWKMDQFNREALSSEFHEGGVHTFGHHPAEDGQSHSLFWDRVRHRIEAHLHLGERNTLSALSKVELRSGHLYLLADELANRSKHRRTLLSRMVLLLSWLALCFEQYYSADFGESSILHIPQTASLALFMLLGLFAFIPGMMRRLVRWQYERAFLKRSDPTSEKKDAFLPFSPSSSSSKKTKILAWLRTWFGAEDFYLEYRVLAEACRVSHAWRLVKMRGDVDVYDHLLSNNLNSDLEWLRQAMAYMNVSRPESDTKVEDTRFNWRSGYQCMLEQWIESQMYWFMGREVHEKYKYMVIRPSSGVRQQNPGKIQHHNQQEAHLDKLTLGLSVTGLLLIAINFLSLEWNWFGVLNEDSLVIKASNFCYGVCFATAAVLKLHSYQDGNLEKANAYCKSFSAFHTVANRMKMVLLKPIPAEGDREVLEALARGLGREALNENSTWRELHRTRPISSALGNA